MFSEQLPLFQLMPAGVVEEGIAVGIECRRRGVRRIEAGVVVDDFPAAVDPRVIVAAVHQHPAPRFRVGYGVHVADVLRPHVPDLVLRPRRGSRRGC